MTLYRAPRSTKHSDYLLDVRKKKKKKKKDKLQMNHISKILQNTNSTDISEAEVRFSLISFYIKTVSPRILKSSMTELAHLSFTRYFNDYPTPRRKMTGKILQSLIRLKM